MLEMGAYAQAAAVPAAAMASTCGGAKTREIALSSMRRTAAVAMAMIEMLATAVATGGPRLRPGKVLA